MNLYQSITNAYLTSCILLSLRDLKIIYNTQELNLSDKDQRDSSVTKGSQLKLSYVSRKIIFYII